MTKPGKPKAGRKGRYTPPLQTHAFKLSITTGKGQEIHESEPPPRENTEQPRSRGSAGAVSQGELAASKESTTWILKVLQPGKKLYDGHGTARPSVFVTSGPRFVQELEQVMADRGGPGSWMWKTLPKKMVQGLARPPGGVTGLPTAQEVAAKKVRVAAAKEEERKRQAKKQKMLDLRDEFLAESRSQGKARQPAAGSSKSAGAGDATRQQAPAAGEGNKRQRQKERQQQQQQVSDGPAKGGGTGAVDDMAVAREQALLAYRLLKSQQQQRQQLQAGGRR